MFVTMNRIPVREDHWPEFEDRFRHRLGQVDQAPGFVRNVVLRPADGHTECHIVMTLWEDRAAFEHWAQSDAFIEAHYRPNQDAQKAREAFKGPGSLEAFESVTDSGA